MNQEGVLVTGGNRGIGREIARQMGRAGYFVWVGCRQFEAGDAVADEVRRAGGQARAVVLDVTSAVSIAEARNMVQTEGGGLSAIVNNAAVLFSGFRTPEVLQTIAVNFWGALHTTDAFLPLLHTHGRIVMVSSGWGDRQQLGKRLAGRFRGPLDRAELVALLREFETAVKQGVAGSLGFPEHAYAMSKIAMNALTEVLHRELLTDERKLLVNGCCPGWVRTDMGGNDADRSVEEGADTPVWLAQLPEGGPSGCFFRDREPSVW
jgi:carbonyl reductase 1